MSNSNGLIPCPAVCATGDSNSEYFVRKGDFIVIPSPLQIVSPDGNEVGEIAEANNGNMTLSTDGQIEIAPGVDSNLAITTDPSVAGNSQGISISRTLPTAETASLLLNQFGDLNINADRSVVLIPEPSSSASVVADGGLVVSPSTAATGDGLITQYNGSATTKPVFYTTYASGTSTGGLTAGNLQTFGYSGASYGTIRKCLDLDPEGDAVVLGDGAVAGGCVVSVAGTSGNSRVYDVTYNPPPAHVYNATPVAVTPALTGGTATANTLRPLFLNSSNQLVTPSSPLVRYFNFKTPNSTLSQVTILDPQGNKYGNDWILTIAGFYNTGQTTTTPDRTYAAWTQPPANNVSDLTAWGVEYDNGGEAPQFVQILAISTQLVGYANYNLIT